MIIPKKTPKDQSVSAVRNLRHFFVHSYKLLINLLRRQKRKYCKNHNYPSQNFSKKKSKTFSVCATWLASFFSVSLQNILRKLIVRSLSHWQGRVLNWKKISWGSVAGIIKIRLNVAKLSVKDWFPIEFDNLKMPAQAAVDKGRENDCLEEKDCS